MPDQGYHRSLPSEVFVPTASIVVEIVSPDDETWEKFDFYAAHQVEEICTAQPTEARLRWFRRDGSAYAESDQSHLLGVSVADLASGISWPR
ncbi:MAG: Uma2 family endonuclease [Acidimicrobiales bacterium]